MARIKRRIEKTKCSGYELYALYAPDQDGDEVLVGYFPSPKEAKAFPEEKLRKVIQEAQAEKEVPSLPIRD